MKNVNLSIPEETWTLARIEAAKRNTSLSALVRGYLNAMVLGKAPVILDSGPEEEDRDRREELVAALRESPLILGYAPNRSATYERCSVP